MKKTLIWILTVVLCISMGVSLSLTGCKGAATETTAAGETTAAAETTVVVETTAAETVSDEPITITWWWGGSWDIWDLDIWVNETIDKYQKLHPNVTIEAVAQTSESLYPAIDGAVESGVGPDICFFWDGIWILEYVWKGVFVPIDQYWSQDEIAETVYNKDEMFDGHLWKINMYTSGKPLVYNKKLFTQAGLDPNKPPTNKEEFLNTCAALKAAGIAPFAVGLKDMWTGGWLASYFGQQYLDSGQDMKKFVVGDYNYVTDTKFSKWWYDVEDMLKKGYFNDDAMSLEINNGWELVNQGKAAMTVPTETVVPSWIEMVGEDTIGVAKFPAIGDGALANAYCMEVNGHGITKWSKNPQAAADFLKFTHSQEVIDRFYEITGSIPADRKFDSSKIKTEQMKKVWELVNGTAVLPMEDIYPIMLDNEGAFIGAQKLFSGESTADEVIQLQQQVIEKWRKELPDFVEKYKQWIGTS